MIDLRTFSKDLLEAIVESASDAQCKLVLHGSGAVIEPDMQVLLERILVSDAYGFCVELFPWSFATSTSDGIKAAA